MDRQPWAHCLHSFLVVEESHLGEVEYFNQLGVVTVAVACSFATVTAVIVITEAVLIITVAAAVNLVAFADCHT